MNFVIITTSVGGLLTHDEHHDAHQRYLQELGEQGVLVAGATFDDQLGGMILVQVDSVEDALSIARRAPRVAAGLERCEVRRLTEVFDPENRLAGRGRASPQGLDIGDSGPLIAPPEEPNFRVIDAVANPAYARYLGQCLNHGRIAADDPARDGYLRWAGSRGLKKLLLLHDETVAGQIEYGPAEVSGLPIDGPGLVVINCLWVIDAFTGLDMGRRLLAACAEESIEASGLATIAYNSALARLPRAYFEKQGFTAIDQLDTGRFSDDEPIAAYLMWRPLRAGAERPSWNRDRLIEGVDFCPAYPWMYGRRRYWGARFPYRARVVKEGLRRPQLLEQFPILATRRDEPWTLVEVGIPAADLSRAIERLQGALIEEPTYYAYIYHTGNDELIIVYPFRHYRVTKDRQSWEEAIRYGLDHGIQRDELVFSPIPLVGD